MEEKSVIGQLVFRACLLTCEKYFDISSQGGTVSVSSGRGWPLTARWVLQQATKKANILEENIMTRVCVEIRTETVPDAEEDEILETEKEGSELIGFLTTFRCAPNTMIYKVNHGVQAQPV